MIGPVLTNGLTLTLTGEIISRPYINLTLQLMTDFGAQVHWTDEQQIQVDPVPYLHKPYLIENDWSAASYWYQIMALSDDPEAEVILPGLFSNSYQGDAAVQHLFEDLGVKTSFFHNENGLECVRLTKSNLRIDRMEYNFINQPDLAQTFVVTCAMLNIPFHFTGLQSLKIKETDRISALINELRKLGFNIGEAHDSELFWHGTHTLPEYQAIIDTYEDHRMAMAFAPCCLTRPEIIINHPQVVSKSYPYYWKDLTQSGFNITDL